MTIPMTDREAAQDYVFGVLSDEAKRLRRQAKDATRDSYKAYQAEADWLDEIMDRFVLVEHSEWEARQQ